MVRQFLDKDYKITNWASLQNYFQNLQDRDINDIEDFEKFLKDLSELESVVSEDLAWRYIKMTCDTANKELESSYIDFVTNIQPQIAPFEDALNKKIHASEFKNQLAEKTAYFIYFRAVSNAIELFREENIELQAELQTLAQKYGSITGAMSVELNGKTLTLQQASNALKSVNREERKHAYEVINNKRIESKNELNDLFNQLVQKRHQVAVNAGFSNFRDYMHKAMGRFDYSVEDCFAFHNAIEKIVVPLLKKLELERKTSLGFDELRPYDLSVDPLNRQALKPFETGEELIDKTINCFQIIDESFAENLKIMKKGGFLDLDSRIGKAPGGYNYPLAESGIPFIFMNAAGSLRDVETMVHEGGHAMHSFLSEDLSLSAFKNAPMEVAEVASMSMELISMAAWNVFFNDENDLKRAKIEQLEGVIGTLPWIATIDAFQHWIYTNPEHNEAQRTEAWLSICKRFETGVTNMEGYEAFLSNSWQKQLHLFEVPFYYIEYGFAQLGAIAIWKNVLKNKTDGLNGYKAMLKLGYTNTIPELYKAANVKFDFSEQYVGELFTFISNQLNELKK